MAPPDTEKWRRHLATCTVCARYDRVLRKGVSLLAAKPELEPEPEFMLHLRYRLADEARRQEMPISNHMGAAVSVMAVLALVAWIPMMVSLAEKKDAVNALETGNESSEIAWHGSVAMVEEPSHVTLEAPAAALEPTYSVVSLVHQSYSPLIIESPISPPSYAR
jgi:hypothetical protein